MTASFLTKSRSHQSAAAAATVLVLQPPRHMALAPLLLSPGRYSIGSDPDSDLVLDAAGIASQHVQLAVGPQGIGLRALDSRTWVNDFLVTETTLRRGDRISIGPVTLTLRPSTPDDFLWLAPVATPVAPVVEAESSQSALSPTIDSALAQVQADRAAVDSVEIPRPHIAVTAEQTDDAPSVAEEVAESSIEVTVSPANLISSTVALPPVDTAAQQRAAWQHDRAEEESRLADQSRQLTTVATALNLRTAELRALEDRLAEREKLLEQRHADACAKQLAAWQRERATQEQQLADLKSQLATVATGLEEREARVRTLEDRLQDRETVLEERYADAFAKQLAAWQVDRSTQERQLADLKVQLAAVATELEEREANVSTLEDRLEERTKLLEKNHADAQAEQRTAWRIERDAEERELADEKQQLATIAAGIEERERRLLALEDRLIKRETTLDQRSADCDAQRAALDVREATLTAERLRLETVAANARSELIAETEKQAAAWTEWEAAQRRLATELNDQLAAVHEAEARSTAIKAEIEAERQAWLLTRQSWEAERAEWETRCHQQQSELAAWETEAQQQRDVLSRQRSEVESQRAELHAEACQRAAAHRELFDARQATQRERRLFAEQQAAWLAERDSQWNELREQRRRWDAEERAIAELHQEARAARDAAQQERTLIAEQQATWLVEHELQSGELREQRQQRDADERAIAELYHEARAALDTAERERRLFAEQQATWLVEREAQCDDLREQRQRLDADERAIAELHQQAQAVRDAAELERRLFAEQQAAWQAERESQWNELGEQRRRLDADERALAELHHEARATREAAEYERSTLALVSPPVVVGVDEPGADTAIAAGPVTSVEVDVERQTEALIEEPIAALPVEVESSLDSAAIDDEAQVVPSNTEHELPDDDAETGNWFHHGFAAEELTPASPFPFSPTSDTSLLHEGLGSTTNFDMPSFHALPESVTPQLEYAESAPDQFAESAPHGAVHEAGFFGVPYEAPFSDTSNWSPRTEDVLAPDLSSAVPAPFPLPYDHPSALPAWATLGESHSDGSSDAPEPIADGDTIETTAAELPAEDDLRAKLAQMFGLPEDFGQRGEEAVISEDPSAASFIERPDSEGFTQEIEVESSTPAAEGLQETAEEEAAWRSRLATLVATPPVEPEPASVRTEAVSVTSFAAAPAMKAAPPPPPTTAAVEEDSIAAYMERLLARNRMGSEPSAAAPVEPPPPRVVTPAPTTPHHESPVVGSETGGDALNDASSTLPEMTTALDNRPRVDKDEVRATLQSFRQVANLSARSALAQHSTKTLRGELVVQGILTGVAGLAAGTCWCGPLWGGSIQPVPGTICLIAAGWMGWQISRSVNRLKNWNPNDRLLSDMTDDAFASTATDSVDELATGNEASAVDSLLPDSPAIRTEVGDTASSAKEGSFQEPAGAEPMGGMIGPRGNL